MENIAKVNARFCSGVIKTENSLSSLIASSIRLTSGFHPDAIGPGHLGLGIMAERAETIGASFNVQSTPDQGTEIRLSWSPQR